MVTERGVHFAHFLRHCAASAAASPIKPRILAEQKVNGTFFFARNPVYGLGAEMEIISLLKVTFHFQKQYSANPFGI